jgi:hypothetical protein
MKRWFLIATCLALAATPCSAERSFTGRWAGTAHIENVWGSGKTFRVVVDIHRDGTVSGTLGEAKLVHGHFRRWRPVGVGRKASGDMMDYMITGRVAGLIIPVERIAAEHVYIPIDIAGPTLDAGVNAHGTTRGADQMGVMSCDLSLKRER